MSTFADLIAEFRVRESSRILSIFQRDEELQKLVSAWGPDVLSKPREDPNAPEESNEIWNWLWTLVQIDEAKLFTKCGVIHLRPKLLQAIETRLIYPDGTVHQWAENHLAQVIKSNLKKPT